MRYLITKHIVQIQEKSVAVYFGRVVDDNDSLVDAWRGVSAFSKDAEVVLAHHQVFCPDIRLESAVLGV
jgi:hypothetical protein